MRVVVDALSVRVGKAQLLEDISCVVGEGQWCTVVGPNGAGKTTLLNAIAGTHRPTSGTVNIDGHDVHALGERERAGRVAFVPQTPIIPAGMSVASYVLLGRIATTGVMRAPSTSDRALVDNVLDRLALRALAERDVATLSGGERQRAVIARALAQNTTTVILDEPTTGLDIRHQMDVLKLLHVEVRECVLTVIASLHDLTLAGLYADHMLLMREGHIALADTPSRVVRSEALAAAYETTLQVVTVDGRDIVIPAPAR